MLTPSRWQKIEETTQNNTAVVVTAAAYAAVGSARYMDSKSFLTDPSHPREMEAWILVERSSHLYSTTGSLRKEPHILATKKSASLWQKIHIYLAGSLHQRSHKPTPAWQEVHIRMVKSMEHVRKKNSCKYGINTAFQWQDTCIYATASCIHDAGSPYPSGKTFTQVKQGVSNDASENPIRREGCPSNV